jgi:peroxiredoxin
MATHSRTLPLGTPAPAFALPDPSGRRYRLEDFAARPLLLIAFICNHCPYVQHMLDGLVQFARDYAPRGVAVVAINPNDYDSVPEDSPRNMARVAAERSFSFPYLYDETQEVTRAYQAMCTPDLYLFDQQRRLLYHGQFDGSSPGRRQPVTGADLRAATDSALAGMPIGPQVASIGCSIKWRPGQEPDWA